MEARDPALRTVAHRRSWKRSDLLGLAPAMVVLAVLFAGSLVGAVRTSVLPLGGGFEQITLERWREMFVDPAFWDGLWFTVRIAVISTALAALGGIALALGLRGRGTALRTLGALPLPVPHLIVATLAVIWLAPGGLADRILGGLPLDLVRDRAGIGIIAVYAYKEAPFIALLALAALGRAVAEREEAAAVLGADRRQRLLWVVWPAIRGPVAVGSMIAGAFAVGAFEVPLAVGPNYPPTLATYAFESTQGDVLAGEGQAAAALLVAGVLAIAMAGLAVRFARAVEDG